MEEAKQRSSKSPNNLKYSDEISLEIATISFTICWFNGDVVKVFTNPTERDNQYESWISIIDSKNSLTHITHNVIDINEEARHLNIAQIKQSALCYLGSQNYQIEESKSKMSSSSLSLWEVNYEIGNDPDSNANLKRRSKYQRLNRDQILFLRTQIKTSKLTIVELSNKYFIWQSTLRKIRRISIDNLGKLPLRINNKINDSMKAKVNCIIMRYYEDCKTEFTVKDVQKYLEVDHLIVLPQHIIREIMKKELRLTFKKWLSRPNNVDFDRLKVLRWMFSVKFATILKDNPLICNIDEWTITRTTKVNYSWSLKGMNKEIKNSPFAGSIYLILAILSNGWWFLLVWHHTINSTILLIFCIN